MFQPRFLALLISLLLLFVPATGWASVVGAGTPVKLTGRIEVVSTFGLPHYELNGYVLLPTNLAELAALAHTEVVVEGFEVYQPTVFMRKAITVERISGKSPEVAPPGEDGREVQTPATPDPAPSLPPGDGNPVSIPAPPVPFYGTSFYLLHGLLVHADDKYYVIEDGPIDTPIWVTGSVDLAALTGKQISAIASREALGQGGERYHIYQAVVISQDLSEQIRAGAGLVYVAPRGEISVRLRGRMVHMDQPPIVGNSRTLVGLRAIAEAMGASVTWDSMTRTATVSIGDRQVLVRVGSTQVLVQRAGHADTIIYNDVAPVIVEGRTMVPVRVLSEGLGLTVSWAAETSTVNLQ